MMPVGIQGIHFHPSSKRVSIVHPINCKENISLRKILFYLYFLPFQQVIWKDLSSKLIVIQ